MKIYIWVFFHFGFELFHKICNHVFFSLVFSLPLIVNLWPTSAKFRISIVGHFYYIISLKLKLPGVVSVWNSNCLVLLQLVGHECIITFGAFVLMKFKLPTAYDVKSGRSWIRRDAQLLVFFLKWSLSHNLRYHIYIQFFKWRRWIFLRLLC
jgi:hypothetical protein